MPLLDAAKSTLSQYATFEGRTPRASLWWWVLAYVLLASLTGLIDHLVVAPALGFEPFDENAGEPVTRLLALALLVPNVAVTVRRLHDVDKPGWWWLFGLIPVLGTLFLINWAVQPGTAGPNQYGEAASG